MDWGSPYTQSSSALGLVEGMETTPKKPRILPLEGGLSNYSGFEFGTGRAAVVDQRFLGSEHSSLSSAAFTPTPTDSTATSSMDEDFKTFTPPTLTNPLLNPYSASIYPIVFAPAPVVVPMSNFSNRNDKNLASNHSSYQQFVFPPRSTPSIPTIESASPFIFQLERHRENLLTAANGAMAQLQPVVTTDGSLVESSKNDTDSDGTVKVMKVKGPGKRGKGKKNLAATESAGIVTKAEAEGEAAKRKEFLERNRVAASKSRKKKKERVGGLSSGRFIFLILLFSKLEVNFGFFLSFFLFDEFIAASGLSAQNHLIQQEAFALRAELLVLRQLVDTHQGCDCEHVLGYLARERTGRGIPTINNLAGRTLHLDYTRFPTMGSNDDVYAGVAGLIVNDREDSEELAEKIDRRTLAGKMRVVAHSIGDSQSIVDIKPSLFKGEVSRTVESEGGRSISRVVSTRSRKGSSASSSFEAAVMDSPGLSNLELPSISRVYENPTDQVLYQQPLTPFSPIKTRPSIVNGFTSFNGDSSHLFPATSFQNDRNLRSRSTLLSSSEPPYIERESSSIRDSYFPTTL